MFKFFLISSLLILQGCLFYQKITIKGKNGLVLEQVDFQSLDGWENDDHKKALQAFIQSCGKFSKMAQNRSVGGQISDIKIGDFRDVCDIAQIVKGMSESQTKNFFENWFKPFEVSNSSKGSKGLFTGYYEASLKGSKVKTDKFRYPVYARPKDLTSEPYLTRMEIESGALEGKGLELLYVDSKAELFSMQTQGSGRIELPNGTVVRVAFAGRNNLPFTGVGAYMVEKEYISRSSLNAASVKEWLENNPEKADEVMNVNTAYTFFKIADGEYVVGGQGVPLTAERSLAVDSDVIPYGFPIWLDTNLTRKGNSKEKYSHLFIAQDTGSAIKGTVRGDIFFGYGDEAEERASYMAAQGKYYILLPINIVDKMRGI